MPFIPNTPESLLARSDSKHPDGTCRGITSGGRPCRRPLGTSPGSTPQATPKKKADRLRADDPSNPDLYCWQHRDQADSSARTSPGPRRPSASGGNRPDLESRESMDTLIDRLGIVEKQQRKGRHHQHHGKNDNSSNNNHNTGRKSSGQGAVRPSEKQSDLSYPSNGRKTKTTIIRRLFCCCFPIPIYEEEEEVEQPHSQQQQQQQQSSSSQQQQQQQQQQQLPARPKPRPVQSAPAPATAKLPASSSNAAAGGSKKAGSSPGPNNPQQNLLSLIPAHTATQTASQLLAELAKPVSAQDEPGYIYIFWLTPESSGSKPPTDAARSLLNAPPLSGSGGGGGTSGSSYLRPSDAAQRQRRPSDVLASYADAASSRPGKQQQQQQQQQGKDEKGNTSGSKKNKKTILLKIGRASNVQRRLNEWTRQCGYDLDLIRYYPYVPSSSNSASSPSSRSSSFSSRPQTAAGAGAGGAADGPRKTPHSHKVERLVHIELSGLGLRALGDGTCKACGRAHREWFEVEASRGGIKAVDEIIRRWCDWDEGRL